METHVKIGSTTSFELREALLVYRSDENRHSAAASAFVTRHKIGLGEGPAPTLGPGTSLTHEDLRSLVQGLQGAVPMEFLPSNVLVRTAASIVWWAPPSIRPMFYSGDRDKEVSRLTGHRFPQPGLVFRAAARGLEVRAVAGDVRPEPGTALCRAPYWNVNDSGNVCLGTAKVPRQLSAVSLSEWERGFFESEFTHPNGAHKLVDHPEGFMGLWKSILGQPRFPDVHLAGAGETVAQFINR